MSEIDMTNYSVNVNIYSKNNRRHSINRPVGDDLIKLTSHLQELVARFKLGNNEEGMGEDIYGSYAVHAEGKIVPR